MERNYSRDIAAGTFLMAQRLTQMENEKTRYEKKQRVVREKRDILEQTFPELKSTLAAGEYWRLLGGTWPSDMAVTFIIDLAFTDPFAPYELKYEEKDFEVALKEVGKLVGVDESKVERIKMTREEASKAHQHIDWGRIAIWAIGAMVVLGTGGWLAAPYLGAAIGAAAGLSGAAATAHGLAILGGGSLAIGGLGMAGGMWMVAGTGAVVGGLLAGGSQALLAMGAQSAREELIKLQVNFREVVIRGQTAGRKAQEVIASLEQRQREIEQRLLEEREMNESNSRRVKDIEATLKALEDSIRWMKEKA